MNQIYENQPTGRRGYRFDEFRERFHEICEEHRTQSRAYGFAFILCDSRHPQVRKVLQDDVYWEALDTISGNRLTVFTLVIRRAGNGRSSGPAMQESRYMVPLRGSEFSGSLQALRPFFGFSGRLELPGILFFQVSEGEVIDSVWIGLHEERIEDAFQEIRSLIEAASDSVSRVTPENARNDQAIFHLIERAVRERAGQLKVKRAVLSAKPVAEFLGVLGGLLTG